MMEDNKRPVAGGAPLPEEFCTRMRALLGEEYPAFEASFSRALPPSLRVNPLRGTPEWAREIAGFFGDGIAWQETGFYYKAPCTPSDIRPGKHPLHEAGLYYIQEASAMLPASLAPALPGERVLDLCAAPGGKASQLAGALGGSGLLVANEIHRGRAGILSQNMERMGVRNALVTSAAPDELAARFPAFFDRIVVDAPCSGEGMFRREADAVSMWSPENVAMCAERQAGILDAAAVMLSPGGYLTYSTCTFAPEEDEGVVMAFLSRHPEFEAILSEERAVCAARTAGLLDGGHPEWVSGDCPEDIREALTKAYRVLPHHADGEGHFAVLLRKSSNAAATVMPSRRKGKKPMPDKKSGGEVEAFALFEGFCRDVFGGVPAWVDETVPCLFGERLFLVPRAWGAETATDVRAGLDGLTVLRAGVCAGTLAGLGRGRGRLEPDHSLALVAETDIDGCLGGRFAVDDDGAIAYLHGETLPAPDVRGWRVITYRGLPLGWGKASDGVMKNHYPKGLRWQ